MKTFIDKLVQLADGLDGLGLKKDADKLDQLVAKAARGEDFGDLMSLFDQPVGFEDEEEKGPGEEKIVLDEPEIHTPLEEEEAPLDHERKPKLAPGLIGIDEAGKDIYAPPAERLHEIKRRHELMKLKEKMKKLENEEAEEESFDDEVKLPVATPEDLSFEDEGDEDAAVNEAEDGGLIDKLKDVLKGAPELASQLLQLVKDNPELLELLAL